MAVYSFTKGDGEMNALEARTLKLLETRGFTLAELAKLLKTSESHVIHVIFKLQDKHPIVIESGFIYMGKRGFSDMWAITAGAFALAFVLAVIL